MSASLAVILLNYKRPQNIGRIVRAAREGLPDAPVFILDQAAGQSLYPRDDVAWNEVWYMRAARNTGAGARVPLAAALPFDLWIAIDDDIFLTAAQIAALAERLRAEPDRAQRIAGQRIEFADGQLGLRNPFMRVDAEVSVLNQVYGFSRVQAQAALSLARRLGWSSWHEIGPVDDILVSCAAPKPPLCHDLGDVQRCPTWNQPGVAVWLSEDFTKRRLDVAARLVAAQSVAVFSPLTVKEAG
jgi:hypothetical protein